MKYLIYLIDVLCCTKVYYTYTTAACINYCEGNHPDQPKLTGRPLQVHPVMTTMIYLKSTDISCISGTYLLL